MLKVTILVVLAVCVLGDDDGQYKPEAYDSGEDGRYIPDNSGLYIPDNSGLYNDDGSGRYSGVNLKYQHQGDGGGRYTGSKDRYSGKPFFNQNRRFQIPSSVATPTVYPSIPPTINLIPAGTFQSNQISIVPKSSNSAAQQNSIGSSGYGSPSNDFGDKSSASSFGTPRLFAKPTRYAGEKYSQGKYDDSRWRIIKQSGDIGSDGYEWEYETENGITAQESGKIANKGSDAEVMKATGFYKYTGPDNVLYTVTYTADENGFIAQGNHLPTPPPIPAAILKSLDYNRATGNL